MKVTEEREDSSLGFLGPLGFLLIMIISAGLLYEGLWIPAIVASALGLLWIALSFRIVRPAFAGLMLQLGSRVVKSETGRYFRIVNGAEVDITEAEFNDPAFDKNAPDVKTDITINYLTKREGWTFICPIAERIVEVSLRQHQDRINEKLFDESDEKYLERAESFTTFEGVHVIPEIFFSYKIINPGKVFELEGGVDEYGNSPFLERMLHDFVLGGARGVMGKMHIEQILTREIKDENGNSVPMAEKIRDDILQTAKFESMGAELLILRIEDIKFKKDAQDVRDALEDVKKQELERQSKIIEADAALEVQKRASDALIVKSNAELVDARNKALGKNAEIAAFVGKKVDQPTTLADGKAYAQYQMGLAVAKSLETGTKVIVPAGDMSKTIAGLVNVFEASKP
ncbi:MAG: SPFH domain-containing protein [Candidatus Azambacteria bacterium]|nr:SPFH domain-containing protein [Candidatus Azambacteria bacterium]